MALVVQTMKRVFMYHGTQFADPGPSLTVEQVRDVLSMAHPDIATAEIEQGDVRPDGTVVYNVRRKVGQKG
ncbi:PRTRC system protein C [Ralstonia pickettii]|uniref:PRTRC system protein C n=1 Tax=Ralstonia pickettii TaxID=329 RepID=A0AAW4Q5B4_RALPI|nr:PRTRC system protein C [Ralstonia pickettii]MBA9846569.1 PRTRC system protein C [Ralstonia pickettii]MBA9851936.1 PRTRC system protein C [Ralstonia pickettii]MBA9919707.1 PRTRC system protein C [Ralstonia pickettii]MBA9958889.1 PRTRC system protein C [Ralstonia pickettii]MBA9965078.1 PRTRC system protein C [Ralstonia pickettii]